MPGVGRDAVELPGTLSTHCVPGHSVKHLFHLVWVKFLVDGDEVELGALNLFLSQSGL